MTSTKEENSVKCVAVGDAAVGKTCLLITYTTGKFPAEYVPTVFDNYETRLEVDGDWCVFQLWDTAGAEHYDVLRPLSYSETDVFLVVYSVVDRKSFNNVETKWVKDIKEKGDKGVPFIIVGNKVDLRDEKSLGQSGLKKAVTEKEGEALQDKLGATGFYEASAYHQKGLKEVFDGCVTVAFERLNQRRAGKKAEAQDQPQTSEATGCGCLLI